RETATIESPVTDPVTGKLTRLRTETSYDNYGRVRTTRSNIRQYGDGTIDRSQERDTTYDYDQFGNLVKTTFPDGTYTSSSYNGQNQLTSEQDQAGHVTQYEYTQDRLSGVDLP